MAGSTAAQAALSAGYIASAINVATGGCYGIVGAVATGAVVDLTCDRAGTVGNNLVVAKSTDAIATINNTNGNMQFGYTGVNIGTNGTELDLSQN